METLDWTKLAGDITPDAGKVPYETHRHLFRKVAFDVFQLNSSPVESLWILEEGEDGQQYLVARYEDENASQLESRGSWAALSDKKGANVTLTYKDVPIQRFASTDYGFTPEDVHVFQKTLIEKLESDPTFVNKLIQSQSEIKMNLLLKQFPELS